MSDITPNDQVTDDPQEAVLDSNVETEDPYEDVPLPSAPVQATPSADPDTVFPIAPVQGTPSDSDAVPPSPPAPATPTPDSDIHNQESEEVEEDDDVFDGEQDENTRLDIEKDLLTDSDNETVPEDGTQPEEVDG